MQVDSAAIGRARSLMYRPSVCPHVVGGGLVVLRGGPLWTSTAAAVRTAGGRFANTVASSRHRQLSRGFRVGPIAKSYWGPQSHFSGEPETRTNPYPLDPTSYILDPTFCILDPRSYFLDPKP